MKVVHVCAMDSGGAGKAAHRLHTGLRAAGVDSAMVVIRKGSSDPSVLVAPSPWYRMFSPGEKSPRARWKRISRRWDNLLRQYPGRPDGLEMFTDTVSEYRFWEIREVREADVVHLHWVAGLLDCRSAPAGLKGKKIVWTLHDMNPFTGGCHYAGDCTRYRESCGACPQLGSGWPDDLSGRAWAMKREAYRNMDIRVVTPSRWLGRCASVSSLLGRFPLEVIPNGIPTDVFRPYPKTESRKSLGVPEEGKVVLFGADYDTRRKGFRHLVDALSAFPVALRDKMVLACFGPLPEGKLPPGVKAIGFGSVSDENLLARIYSCADVFVLPSEEDNLPNTVLESMACGIPVAGFDIGGMPDMVENGRTGKLASPGSVKGLVDAMECILSRNATGILAGECRRKAEAEYSLPVQAERYRGFYLKALPGTPGSSSAASSTGLPRASTPFSP